VPLRRTALAALLLLLSAPPAHGRETVAPAPRAAGPAVPGERVPAALESTLPRRCGICHLDRAPAAAAGRIAFKPPAGQAGAGDAGLCYSCHGGIVADDRRALWSGRHHPSSGKVSCGSCHTPHVQAPNVGPFMRFAQGNYSFCTGCHPGRRAGDAGEHPAVAAERGRAQDCGGCHAVHRAQGEGLIRAASAESLCGPCHGDNPSRAGRGPGLATHVTGAKGPPCLGCHDVHKTAGGKMLLDKAALDGRLCRQCHERNYSAAKSEANHPVAPERAVCVSCHRMHNAEKQGTRRGLLAAAWAEPDTICRRCHADSAGPGKGGAWNHPLEAKATGEERPLAARLAQAGAFFAPGGRLSCLSCHRAHAGRPGTPQLTAPREALCLYCHPAQNALVPEGAAPGSHPVSVKPKRARIDAAFIKAGGTTGPGGEISCTTCHRAHGGSAGTPGLVLSRATYSCLLCHTREAAIAGTPHSTARAPQAAAGKAAAGLCGGCHGEHGWRVPLADEAIGRTVIERICFSCHGTGASGAPFGGTTNHPVGVTPPPGQGTAGLPLFWSDGRRYRQGVITCATCHDVHAAGAGGRFLRASLGRGGDLCVGCHAAESQVARTRHDLSQAQGSLCGPCHTVHDPLSVASWPTARGGGDRAAADLGDYCGSCHRPGGEAAGAVVAERFHPVAPAGATARASAGRGVGCGGCHDPHRWNPADPKDRSGSAAGKFLVRSVAGPAALCTGCHAPQAAVEGTPHDLKQAGAQAGVCSPCHRAHGAQPLALSRPQPQKPGEKAAVKPGRDGDPCEICHAAGGIAANSTIGEHGHPVGVNLKLDPGPDLPLFAPSGRRQAVGGRIACATCHDAHRWAPEGGSGTDAKAAASFLRLAADGYAPLCFPCHAEKSTVVGTDHDLRVTAPAAVNRAGLNAEASGVCGACHAMHRGQPAKALWNRGFGQGRDEASRACGECHRAGNDLGARVPPRLEAHLVNFPGRGLVSRLFTATRSAAGASAIPLFAEDGTRADNGYLSCVSCHDIHRWDAASTNAGPGKPVEGDATNSFLRLRGADVEKSLCGECHGESPLEHFKNYHFPEGR
jgi:predicted CXXCH cytochrome family protein